ncbi:cohesin domain-containing protein [bacterium]|nr:cohesin domain-containing protein [bacterium]
MSRFWRIIFSILVCAAGISPSLASASILSLSPSTGTFEAGGVLESSILLDSEGQMVNALNIELRFPAEKLQLITPTTGNSIISLWTSQPTVNNETGILRIQGVTPGGMNVSRGLVTNLRFRVKAPGEAFIKFTDETRVLLHDGAGTDVLRNTNNAVFTLRLPPPLGPVVASPTHPDQGRWYSTKTALLEWTPSLQEITGFSYVLNTESVDIPDDVSEGTKRSVVYKNLTDDTHYFHIKSLQGSSWGGVTHFALHVDVAPPAEFPLEILPSPRTNSQKPVLQFFTTDALSGMSHYEMKLIPLSPEDRADQPIFVEAQSPFVFSELPMGRYDVILRAYDNAGNYREVTERLAIVAGALQYFDEEGLYLWGVHFPWWLLILLLLFLILLLYLFYRLVKRWRGRAEERHLTRAVPVKVAAELAELEKYREKYGKFAVTFLFMLSTLFATFFAGSEKVFAQTEMLDPPLFESISRDITNEDIFYAGGKTTAANVDVVLYVQNARTGEVISEKVMSDKEGEWFYRHDTFLDPGTYTLWAQAKVGNEVSPPSPERSVNVQETVLQIGASRFSYDFMYLAVIGLLLLIVFALVVAILTHWRHGKVRHNLWMREVREAEDAVRAGFAKLRHDIEVELGTLKKLAHSRKFSEAEEAREKVLLADLEQIEAMIGKEVLDIERVLL